MESFTTEQLANIFTGLNECESNNGYHMTTMDALRILKELSFMVEELKRNPEQLNGASKFAIETVTKYPGGVLLHPDNVRNICEAFKQEVPQWYVEKWGHRFLNKNKNEVTDNSVKVSEEVSVNA